MSGHVGPSDDLIALAERVLDGAEPGEAVEVALSRRTSTSVKAYGGAVESLTSADSSGAGVRVIRDGREGFAHCGSLDPDVLAESLSEARHNCSFSEPDEFNGLARSRWGGLRRPGAVVGRRRVVRPGEEDRPRHRPGASGPGPRRSDHRSAVDDVQRRMGGIGAGVDRGHPGHEPGSLVFGGDAALEPPG